MYHPAQREGGRKLHPGLQPLSGEPMLNKGNHFCYEGVVTNYGEGEGWNMGRGGGN